MRSHRRNTLATLFWLLVAICVLTLSQSGGNRTRAICKATIFIGGTVAASVLTAKALTNRGWSFVGYAAEIGLSTVVALALIYHLGCDPAVTIVEQSGSRWLVFSGGIAALGMLLCLLRLLGWKHSLTPDPGQRRIHAKAERAFLFLVLVNLLTSVALLVVVTTHHHRVSLVAFVGMVFSFVTFSFFISKMNWAVQAAEV